MMNALQLLTQQLDRRWKKICLKAAKSTQEVAKQLRDRHKSTSNSDSRSHRALASPVSGALALVCLTGVVGQRFYNEPQLDVGTRVTETIYAPEAARVPDLRTTEAKRRQATIGEVPLLMRDEKVDVQITKHVDKSLKQGSELRQVAGAFPYTSTGFLTQPVQHYLRSASRWEWQAVLAAVQDRDANPPEPESTQTEKPESDPTGQPAAESENRQSEDRQKLLEDLRAATARGLTQGLDRFIGTPDDWSGLAIEQLQRYRDTRTAAEFADLKRQIERSRDRYDEAIAALKVEPESIYSRTLFELSDTQWQEIQADVKQVLALMLDAPGIAPGTPDELLENAVRLHLQFLAPDRDNSVAVEVLLAVLQPNLVRDDERTRLRAEQAARAVDMVYVTIEQYEPIVREGEEVTRADFVLLDYFGLVQRTPVNWLGLLGFSGIVFATLGGFWFVERQVLPKVRQRDRLLILILALSAPVLVIFPFSTTSLPAVGLLVGSFYGSFLSTATVGLLGLLMQIGIGPTLGSSYLIAGAISGLLGGVIAGRLRCREELALLGLGVGFTQGIAYLIVNLIMSGAAGPVWTVMLGEAGLQAMLGVSWSIVALGVSPYLEHLFDLVTPIRLAELSNPNRPLLKRLAREAPGTFQHTMFVATLAEAAARDLGCNVELVRAGTLYHDIGKMHDPLGFVENQMGGPNKHDKINNPWLSAKIIKKHVSEGIVMAKKARLPKAIRAFIPEHQGTMSIAYFYYQAKQNYTGQRQVREEDFRYEGPIPQSRETGIVMLADSCEAALRSLEDATTDEALVMVNKILRARWKDNQLLDSGLTRDDMSQIAEIFVRVWQQFNHKRIAYPKGAISPACQK
ncbi:MAG: HDIG domain-containing protein [Cyanobacteriota bacterium]|nr:HDIG domain-containing protein [Cyanobacteriota bacterium]